MNLVIFSILDVLATLEDKTQISIEIQLNDQHHFLKHSLFIGVAIYFSNTKRLLL